MRLERRWHHARKRWSWEFEDFEKMRVEIGPLRRELGIRPLRVEFWPLKGVVGIFGSLPTENLNTTRCAARWDGISAVRILSLSSRRHGPKPEVNKPIVFETTESAYVLCLYTYLYDCCDWYHYGYAYTTKYSSMSPPRNQVVNPSTLSINQLEYPSP